MARIRLKRRMSGAPGAPAGLLNSEPAYNAVDDTLYLGFGDDGAGNATSVIPLAGRGAFLALSGDQAVSGIKTFNASPLVPTAAAGDNTTKAASTAFVTAAIAAASTNQETHAATAKTTPVDADELPLVDSAASWGLRRLTWANVKATLKTYFDTLYSAVGHGHTFASLTAKPTTVSGYGITDAVTTDRLGAANGVATLGADSKVTPSQLPAAVAGGLSYQGVWDASANSPALPAAAPGNKGYYWKVSVAGSTNLDGITDWKVGDWAVSNGTSYDKIDNTDQVSSVAGRTGAVTLSTADVSGLGSMATQAANNVAITGGTIVGVILDGGQF